MERISVIDDKRVESIEITDSKGLPSRNEYDVSIKLVKRVSHDTAVLLIF